MGTGGIDGKQISKDSLLRTERDYYFGPEASNTQKIVANVDPSTLTVGTALTLATNVSGKALRRARRPTLTLTDASGGSGGLTATVKLEGARWGNYVSEFITVTCTDGNATTTTAANVYDEVTAVTPVNSLSTAAAGDNLCVGIDGTSFGLDFPIDNVADVISIINVSTNTEQAPTAVSSTTVSAGGGPGGSFIKGLTLATTDRWEIRYVSSTAFDTSGTTGVWR